MMLASGFAGLGYQIVWTAQASAWLGHEWPAILAVVAAFFSGMAAGSWALGARIARTSRPARWYAGSEAVIASWGLLLAVLLSPISALLLALTGAHPSAPWQWSVAMLGTFVVLLPATAAMGSTLPAMARVTEALGDSPRGIALLYASNTLGAMLGVLASAFILLPRLGLLHTALLCALLNACCALLATRLSDNLGLETTGPRTTLQDERLPAPGRTEASDGARSLVLLGVTGLLGIGYEIVVVRVLSQVAENTVYTFSLLLAVYLLGTAAGAHGYHRLHATAAVGPQGNVTARLSWWLALTCLLGATSLWFAPAMKQGVMAAAGTSMGSALIGEVAISLAAFLPPTVVMGALFSHLCTAARASGVGFAHSLAVNTMSSACAPLVFGVLLLPTAGARATLLIIVIGYAAVWAVLRRTALPIAGAALVIAGIAIAAPPLAFVDVPEGGRILSYREGASAAVSVIEDAAGVMSLRINNRQQEGSSVTAYSDSRQALIPLLLHPAPDRVLFLGLGTGATAASAARDPALLVDVVELLPEVIAASRYFVRDHERRAAHDRLNIMAADARRYVRVSNTRYDLIVSDNFHPARSGSGALYTMEHFAAVRDRLRPGGVFCQWLPLHQLDLHTLRSIVQAFLRVYPQGNALLATYSLETPVLGLVARADAPRLDLSRLGDRLRTRVSTLGLAAAGLNDELALLGTFVAAAPALARFAGDALPNSDDRPVVAYRAPHITYAPDSTPGERLLELMQRLTITARELVDPADEAALTAPLTAYWRARGEFLGAGSAVRASSDVRTMLAQVRDPLLAVLRVSADFRPAYDPLLRMAEALSAVDAASAGQLLRDLQQIAPGRPEAARLLQTLHAN